MNKQTVHCAKGGACQQCNKGAQPDRNACPQADGHADRTERQNGTDRQVDRTRGDNAHHSHRQNHAVRVCFQNIDQISDCEESAGAYAEEHSKQQTEADKQTQGSIPAKKAFHAVAPRSRSKMSRCSSSGDESFAMISAMQRPARMTKIRSAISNT